MPENHKGIQVIGEEIFFKGVKVATLEKTLTSSYKRDFVELIDGMQEDDEQDER